MFTAMNAPVPAPSILDAAGVDPERARSILGEALAGADDGELFVERSESESFLFDDGRLKSAAYDATEGFGLRVVAGETAGYAHASEISEAAIGRAADSARLARRGYSGVAAEAHRATNAKLYGDDNPLSEPGFSDKVALLQEIDAWARARDPRVVQVMASLAGERRTVEILRADGRLIRDVRPLCRINVQVTVERDGRREQGYTGAGGRAGFEAWIRSTRRCGRRWSISTPFPARPARWTWCWDPAGMACCCTRRWAMVWRATSTARAPRPSQGGSASGWPRPASPYSTTAPCREGAGR
jgi:TldD protein